MKAAYLIKLQKNHRLHTQILLPVQLLLVELHYQIKQ